MASAFAIMRQNMVKGQVLPEGVTQPALLEALLKVPREKFVPGQLAHIAYMDAHFFFNRGRFLLRPACLARLLEGADLAPWDVVLYVGAGTGYGPALLSQMGIHVVALDCEEALTQEAERLIGELNFPSIEIVLGPLQEGWQEKSPYDKVIIEGCISSVPAGLAEQVKEGGCLITIKTNEYGRTEILKMIKCHGSFTDILLGDAFAPHLDAFYEKKIFKL